MTWCAAALVPAAWLLFGWRAAVGLGAGMAWSLANTWTLARLVYGSAGPQRLSRWRQVAWWIVKLPLLYGVLLVAVISPWSSAVGFLVGFSLWFFLLVADALRRAPT